MTEKLTLQDINDDVATGELRRNVTTNLGLEKPAKEFCPKCLKLIGTQSEVIAHYKTEHGEHISPNGLAMMRSRIGVYPYQIVAAAVAAWQKKYVHMLQNGYRSDYSCRLYVAQYQNTPRPSYLVDKEDIDKHINVHLSQKAKLPEGASIFTTETSAHITLHKPVKKINMINFVRELQKHSPEIKTITMDDEHTKPRRWNGSIFIPDVEIPDGVGVTWSSNKAVLYSTGATYTLPGLKKFIKTLHDEYHLKVGFKISSVVNYWNPEKERFG